MASRALMTSVVFTAPGEVTVMDEGPRPQAGDEELAGKTVVTLISPGTELAGLRNVGGGVSYPVVLGYAAVFDVTEVGPGVNGFRPGDRLLCHGKHCSWQVSSFREVLRVPVGLDPPVAAAARLAGVGMTALTLAGARPPNRVLVSGLGIIGNLAAQLFAASGYQVLAWDPRERARQLACQLGFEVREEPPVGDALWDGTAALVLECSGTPEATLDACRLVMAGGEVMLIGVPRGEFAGQALVKLVFERRLRLRSGLEWSLPLRPERWAPGSMLGNQQAALTWLAAGRITVNGLIDCVDAADAAAAYARLTSGPPVLSYCLDWSKA